MDGIINSQQNFFSWIDGYPRSGYNNYRQGSLKNCPFHFIPCDRYYPSGRIQSHSNGTWK